MTTTIRSALALTGLAAFVVGCDSDSTLTPDTDALASANEDAARIVAADVSQDSGGLLDQLGDVVDAASAMDFGSLRAASDRPGLGEAIRDATYDEVAGVWTITISRERGLPTGTHYAFIERVYEIQFLNPDGEPQQFYDTDGVVASSIAFDIISGTGIHQAPRFEHELTLLEGSFLATNTDTDQITINGTYSRAASSVHRSRNAERTIDHTVDFTVTDLVGPRGVRRDWTSAVSGTIEGDFHADITWVRGDAYAERTIDRHVLIVIEDGEIQIDVTTTSSGSVNTDSFGADAASGELG